MSQRADESIDRDLLLEFTNEPTSPGEPAGSVQPSTMAKVAVPVTAAAPPSQSSVALQARLDRLEHAVEKVSSQASVMRSQLATLVGAIDDIRKKQERADAALRRHPVAVAARPRSVAAVVGLFAGVALGIFGWTIWSRDSIDAIGVVAEPVAAEPLAAPVEPPPQPAIAVASVAAPLPVASVPVQPVAPARVAGTEYVGTLSIDAAPNGEVFIDRRPAGRTPLRVPNLRAGSHLVWIERDGYRRFTRVVQVPADQVSRVWADLEPLPAR